MTVETPFKKALVVSAVCFLFLSCLPLAYGFDGWLDVWNYRKKLTFDVELDGHTCFNVTVGDLDYHCQNDFEDLRLVDYFSGALIPVWNETMILDDYITLWFYNSGDDVFYLYYGNPAAPAYWVEAEDIFTILDNCQAVYLFDEGSGSTINDLSGNSNDGSFVGLGNQWVSYGAFDNGLLFNGSGGVSLPLNDADFNPNYLSILVRGNFTRSSNYQRIFDFGSQLKGQFVIWNDNGLSGYLRSNSSTWILPRVTSANWSDGDNVFIETFDTDLIASIYCNGVLCDTDGGSYSLNSYVGTNTLGITSGLAQGLIGYLEYFCFFNDTLTSSEISLIGDLYPDPTFEDHYVYLRSWVDPMPAVSFSDGTYFATQPDTLGLAFIGLVVGVVAIGYVVSKEKN